jgi:hypothetical protein
MAFLCIISSQSSCITLTEARTARVVSSVMRIFEFYTGSIFIERMLNDVLYAERIGKVDGAYFVAGESCTRQYVSATSSG